MSPLIWTPPAPKSLFCLHWAQKPQLLSWLWPSHPVGTSRSIWVPAPPPPPSRRPVLGSPVKGHPSTPARLPLKLSQ